MSDSKKVCNCPICVAERALVSMGVTHLDRRVITGKATLEVVGEITDDLTSVGVILIGPDGKERVIKSRFKYENGNVPSLEGGMVGRTNTIPFNNMADNILVDATAVPKALFNSIIKYKQKVDKQIEKDKFLELLDKPADTSEVANVHPNVTKVAHLIAWLLRRNNGIYSHPAPYGDHNSEVWPELDHAEWFWLAQQAQFFNGVLAFSSIDPFEIFAPMYRDFIDAVDGKHNIGKLH